MVIVSVIGVLFKTYPFGAVISVIVIVSLLVISVIFIPSIVIIPFEFVLYGADSPLFMLTLNTASTKGFLLEASCFNNCKLYEPVGFGNVTSELLE